MYNIENLKKIRKKYNLTIYDMADKIGITPTYYYLIEQKKRNLYYDLAIKIASVFNMKPDQIFYTKKSS